MTVTASSAIAADRQERPLCEHLSVGGAEALEVRPLESRL
jgi:hypothetical protein